jgi:hypothetical protein
MPIPFGTSPPIQILEPQEYISQRSAPNITLISLSRALDPHVDHIKYELKNQQLRGRDHLVPAVLDDTGDESWIDDHDDEYLGSSQNDARASNLFRKRTSKDCGIFRMDCALARSACNVSIPRSITINFDGMIERRQLLTEPETQNACYYQNCVMSGSTVRYIDGGGKRFPQNAPENRVDAGTTTNPSSPCRIMPLSQKTFDQWPNWKQNNFNLQLDEWPMAAMSQPEFSTLSPGTVRNSLRCIQYRHNSSRYNSLLSEDIRLTWSAEAGSMYKFFRQATGNYNPDKNAKYAHLRTCNVPGG